MLREIKATIKIETRDKRLSYILHCATDPENLTAPEDIKITQRWSQSSIIFTVATNKSLLKLASTIDDFLFSVCLAYRVLIKLKDYITDSPPNAKPKC